MLLPNNHYVTVMIFDTESQRIVKLAVSLLLLSWIYMELLSVSLGPCSINHVYCTLSRVVNWSDFSPSSLPVLAERPERSRSEPGGVHVVLRRVWWQSRQHQRSDPGEPHEPALGVLGPLSVANEEATDELPNRVRVLGRHCQHREEIGRAHV